MKQVQFAILELTEGNSQNVRKEVEGPLNNGWTLQDWKPVGITKDVNNMSAVSIVVCLVRELPDEPEVPTVRRGRPAKVEEPELANA